jgi:tetratricopeptide (TPR) repeat protein
MSKKFIAKDIRGASARGALGLLGSLLLGLIAGVSLLGSPAFGQEPAPAWQVEVRRYAEVQNWAAALRIVDQQIARTPQDLDVRAWRARLLAWSGQLAEAEREYTEILKAAPNDADNWMGLASVYAREERKEEALGALDRAVELNAERADLRAARGRALRALGRKADARREFQKSLELAPGSIEARAGLLSLRGEPKQELRLGLDNDLFSYASANHDQWVSLVSQWTPHWTTSVAGNFYQRDGTGAGKFIGSLTGRRPHWGALTLGGGTGHDNAVIPTSEAFFEYDHGWKISKKGFARGVEVLYGQHWYWYSIARILTLTETTIVYLPREWTWSLGLTGARSHFPGTNAEWRPSGVARLGFPIADWSQRRLSGNVFFAVGTENFGQVDQIGAFASRTYGGGVRFQFTARQDVTGYGAFQQRTQDRAQTSFGFTYGIHF